jgi:hypothetical protein
MEQFVANFGPWLGVFSAFVVAFAALARLTPTKSDDKIVEYLQTIFSVLGLHFPDNKGKEEEK